MDEDEWLDGDEVQHLLETLGRTAQRAADGMARIAGALENCLLSVKDARHSIECNDQGFSATQVQNLLAHAARLKAE